MGGKMKIKWALPGFIFVLFAFAFSLGNKDGEEGRIEGFTIQHSDLQRQLENKLKSLPQPKNCEKYLRFLTEEPHIAGTDEDYRLAQYVRDRVI
jgi:N-acetylated-alpha-linked acidic dipeptidase